MNRTMLLALVIVLQQFFGLSSGAQDAVMKSFIDGLMKKMTLEEKIGQLNLVTPGMTTGDSALSTAVYKMLENGEVGAILNLTGVKNIRQVQEWAVTKTRMKIPLLFGLDVIHGYKTTFPIPLALSCSWDMQLIQEAAHLAAREATAEGLTWTFSPMVDISKDPRWGRIAEGAGEDPFLGAAVAKAMVRGYQTDTDKPMVSCVKHFAAYGAAEAGLDYNSVDMSLPRLFNEYMLPYKVAIEAGAGSVMTGFHTINYVPVTANKWLLTDVLRKRWGFKGFVVSDYASIKEMISHGVGDLKQVSAAAINSGCDMDMMSDGFVTSLKKNVEEGKVSIKQINAACRRILEAKYKLGLFADPFRYCKTDSTENQGMLSLLRSKAKAYAERSFVLLKNERQILPLKPEGTIALIGPLADDQVNVRGMWTVDGSASSVVTVKQGMNNWSTNNLNVQYSKGANITDDAVLVRNINTIGKKVTIDQRSPEVLLQEALDVVQRSDVIVAVVGEAAEMSGESSSRTSLNLPANQMRLLKALKQTSKPLVLVIMAGRPLTINWELDNVDAIVWAWHAGDETGNAVADVLFGKYNPSGKLTTTFPRSVGQIPIYYNHLNTGKPNTTTAFKKWKTNYLDAPATPLFPFGYGLSYTSFSYGEIKLTDTVITKNKRITATVSVTNTGNYDGEEVVQLYVQDVVGSIARPVKELKGFEKIYINKGETKEVQFSISIEDLKFYNTDLKYVAEPGEFRVFIGGNSVDVKEGRFWMR